MGPERLRDVMGEVTIGEYFLPGLVEVRWYPYDGVIVREFLVPVERIREVVRRLAGKKWVRVWFTRKRRADGKARGYWVKGGRDEVVD